MSDNTIIKKIKRVLSARSSAPIERKLVRSWMRNEDIEVLGAVFSLLNRQDQYSRIYPGLTFEDYRQFHKKYFTRCLREDPKGEWCDSRYIAGYSLTQWFKNLWYDTKIPKVACLELKELLAELIRKGDDDLKLCIITAILEHLFEDNEILEYFSDWEKDPQLEKAYKEAISYI